METNKKIINLFLFVWLLFFTTVLIKSASSDSLLNCEVHYRFLQETLQNEWIDRGVQQKISAKVENAWRMHCMGKTTEAIHQLDIAEQMINSEPTKKLPEDIRERLRAGIIAFRNCLRNSISNGKATLKIFVFHLDETAPDLFGQSAGAGVFIRINGQTVATTDADGTALIVVPSGTIVVSAIIPSTAIGTATITLAPGETRELRLLLDDGKEVVESTDLILDELNEGIIPWNFSTFTLRFISNGNTIPLKNIDDIELLGRVPSSGVKRVPCS